MTMKANGYLAGMLVVLGLMLVGCGSMAATTDLGSESLHLHWTNNMLTVAGPKIPGGTLKIWYLEAFCRRGSTRRDWRQTTIRQRTELVSAQENDQLLVLRSHVEPNVEVLHEIRAGGDEVDFRMSLRNRGKEFADIDWLQPCVRVDGFTGRGQSNYVERCFLFTRDGLRTLDKTQRTEEALYRGGQVYVPEGIDLNDVNPRPISPDRPVNGLIGCFSADNQSLLATAWDHTQELFQGVIVCIHNDPRVGGLKPGEVKKLHGKLYILKNDPKALLERYRRDFPEGEQ
jgi:hypothetical protein